jgi:alanine racemase
LLNWVEIDARALRSNLRQFRDLVAPDTSVAAVVKANAYGHGMLEVARIVRAEGAEWLCVNSIDEAVELRAGGLDGRVLILGYVPLDRLDLVVEHDLRPTVYNRETVDRLAALAAERGRTVPVHLKVETGTQRQGVAEAEVPAFVAHLRSRPGLVLEGISTHFANIEDTTDHAFALAQVERFRAAVDVASRGGPIPMRHAACSAAALLFARTHFDLVRIGISLYGMWPSRETLVSCRERERTPPRLEPYRTSRPSRIAVLPVGYYEGFDRRLSSLAHVLVAGRRAPVRGRVCMNMCMVDVTDVPEARLEDEVVLLGRQGDERITAEQIAAWCATIPYEVVTGIHPSLPRVVLGA